MTLVRYLAATLLKHMLGVFGVLAALLWIFTVLDQSEDVGSGHYTFTEACRYSFFMLPDWFGQFAAMAAFLGAITGIGSLHQDSEITAMRAAGWSIGRIAFVASSVGVALAAAGLLVGETLAPRLTLAAIQRKAELRFGPDLLATSAGVWTQDQHHIIGLDRRSPRAVTVLTLGADGELLAYADARGLRQVAANSFAYTDYSESRIAPEGIERHHDAQLPASSGAESLVGLSEDTMGVHSMRQMLVRIRELAAAGLDRAELVYELHDRVARVFVAPILVLLAVISIVGPLRSSRRSSRLVLGIVTGFALLMCRDAAQSMVAVFGFSPVTMAWAPLMLLLIAVMLIGRTVRARRPVPPRLLPAAG
jgi:lipopolysaccharide export system permease protein